MAHRSGPGFCHHRPPKPQLKGAITLISVSFTFRRPCAIRDHYILEHIDLYERLDDPKYLAKKETFESWYENPIDLPGRWSLQVITQLFKENRFAKGEFVGLGRRLNLTQIRCPVYLLVGEADDITTREQVFDAEKYLGTPNDKIQKQLVPGGHIGLFMGSRTLNLKETWPGIARWIRDSSRGIHTKS